MKNKYKLILAMLFCLGAGIIGSFATQTGPGSWYQTINRPAITPPGYVFPIAWTTLYILMGLALYIVWAQPPKYRKDPALKKSAMIFFIIQLIINIAWSFLFFSLKSPIAGLICIAILLGLVAITILKFYKLNEKAAYLLIPYLLWLCFATILNFLIFTLN
ncbi:MAG TPA: tryptophan-rich sensory protein [Candidatus Diapherotrites archaeon]|nr:tryptophan-rich sensory protein [Candidatus Diapherotrites archaeon]